MMDAHLAERFWRRVDRNGPFVPALGSRCWIWTGGRGGKGRPSQRYGQFKGGRAHRIAFTLERGTIPAGLVLDHLCRRRVCVNPEHLEPVTHAVNILRGNGFAGVNARKKCCKHGHRLVGGNLLVGTGRPGKRRRSCRACARARVTKWKMRNGL